MRANLRTCAMAILICTVIVVTGIVGLRSSEAACGGCASSSSAGAPVDPKPVYLSESRMRELLESAKSEDIDTKIEALDIGVRIGFAAGSFSYGHEFLVTGLEDKALVRMSFPTNAEGVIADISYVFDGDEIRVLGFLLRDSERVLAFTLDKAWEITPSSAKSLCSDNCLTGCGMVCTIGCWVGCNYLCLYYGICLPQCEFICNLGCDVACEYICGCRGGSAEWCLEYGDCDCGCCDSYPGYCLPCD